ncbi:MAG: phosphoglucosamine mutase [Candidatus Methylopumilus sp.]|nr:phosphoglucosamine mutase [Candidatus Methylopumilus sp.]
MARQFFGTDGIRGVVGQDPITPDFFIRLGFAIGSILVKNNHDKKIKHPSVVIGKDTRVSGYMLESALEAGFIAAGVNVYLTGPMPTPAIAYLTKALRSQAGVVISASHNPFPDNGIKIFSEAGEKLSDAFEIEVELALNQPIKTVLPHDLGKAKRVDDAPDQYIEFCKSTFPENLNLHGLKIVLDCAHGATYHVAPKIFSELGAEVITVGNEPDGFNINLDVGSTNPKTIKEATLKHKADLGIAFDGDGDRVVMIDHLGHIVDGDQLVLVIARALKQKNQLKGGVVGTLMTNMAIENALHDLSIDFVRTHVGDRYVLETLLEKGWSIGGENSGHILTLDQHSTGDAIIASLQVLKSLRLLNQSLHDATKDSPLYPQVLINVVTSKKIDLENNKSIQDAIKNVESKLNDKGRVLLRPSGTEPKIRVMVEGEDLKEVKSAAELIAKVVGAEV